MAERMADMLEIDETLAPCCAAIFFMQNKYIIPDVTLRLLAEEELSRCCSEHSATHQTVSRYTMPHQEADRLWNGHVHYFLLAAPSVSVLQQFQEFPTRASSLGGLGSSDKNCKSTAQCIQKHTPFCSEHTPLPSLAARRAPPCLATWHSPCAHPAVPAAHKSTRRKCL